MYLYAVNVTDFILCYRCDGGGLEDGNEDNRVKQLNESRNEPVLVSLSPHTTCYYCDCCCDSSLLLFSFPSAAVIDDNDERNQRISPRLQ